MDLSLFTRCSLRGRDEGKVIFESMKGTAFEPAKVGEHEPIRADFSYEQIDLALDIWVEKAYWKTVTKGLGGVSFSKIYPHDRLFFWDLKASPDEVLSWVRNLNRVFPIDFVSYSAVVEGDVRLPDYEDTVYALSMMNSGDLVSGIPTMPWLTICGEPYIDMWGRENLLSAPVAKAEEVDDLVVLQLTEEMSDLVKRPDYFWDVRNQVIEHLGAESFQVSNPGKVVDKIPEFEWVKPKPEQ